MDIIEEKILLLSQYEADRDYKRQELEILCEKLNAIKNSISFIENDLVELDTKIDTIEHEIVLERSNNNHPTLTNNNNNIEERYDQLEQQQQHHTSLVSFLPETTTPSRNGNKKKVKEEYDNDLPNVNSASPPPTTTTTTDPILTSSNNFDETQLPDDEYLTEPMTYQSPSNDNRKLKKRKYVILEEHDDDNDDNEYDEEKKNDNHNIIREGNYSKFNPKTVEEDLVDDDDDVQEFTPTQRPFASATSVFYDNDNDDNDNDYPVIDNPIMKSTTTTRLSVENNNDRYIPRVSAASVMESLPLTTITTKGGGTTKDTRFVDHSKQQQQQKNTNGNNGLITTLDSYFKTATGKDGRNSSSSSNQVPNNTATTSLSSTMNPYRSGSTNPSRKSSVSYPWTDDINTILRKTFKIQSFRDQQKDIIDATLSGQDVFVIMRTGGGKSLTYQLPALYEGRYTTQKKVTFVISPLLSLIQDQVEQMNEFCLNSATSFTSGMTGGAGEHAKRWEQVRDPNSGICLVFVTPEKVHQSNKLCSEMEKLFKQNRLGRFVIDECHCACQWGHDFRPDYTQLGKLKAHFPSIPIIAVTATASERVREDVCKILRIDTRNTNKYKFFRSTANRPNLNYSVKPKLDNNDQVIIDMVTFIKQYHPHGAGIVYTYSRKDADQVANSLCEYGIIARPYHSDVSNKQKEDIHRSWMQNRTQVVVATIAFGLGINKPDVRFVLHHSISKTLEAYYQESGRAGRDGNPADCILYYSPKDFTRLLKMVHGTNSEKQLLPMIRYAQASGNDAICKAIILNHLGEPNYPNVIDVERENASKTTYQRDVGFHAQIAVRLLQLRLDEGNNITTTMLVKEWRSNSANTPTFVKENSPTKDGLSADDCERIIISLILESIIQPSPVWNAYDTVIYLTIGPRGYNLLTSPDPKVVIKLPLRDTTAATAKKPTTKASKQAATRRSIPANGEWHSAKTKKAAAKPKTKKATAGKTKAKATKKKKAPSAKGKRSGSKKATAATKARSSATQRKASSQDVIDISSDDERDNESYQDDSEHEFDG